MANNMELYLDCLPCMLRQVVDASRMSTNRIELQHRIMDEAIVLLRQYKTYRNSSELCRAMHRLIKDHTGVADAYSDIKCRDIQTALKLYPKIERFVKDQQDLLYWALKAAALGNVLDSSFYFESDLETSVDAELGKPFAVCDIKIFKQQLQTAKRILVIGDNCGETVLDCILLEQLAQSNITYAVRSAPIINDATMQEAYESGLDRYAKIISTGCDVPGILLDECSEEFLEIFQKADIVISKGQGNYETLSECSRDIYFLLKSKCLVVSNVLGVSLNDFVFKYSE